MLLSDIDGSVNPAILMVWLVNDHCRREKVSTVTPHNAMRLYCQTLIELLEAAVPGSATEHTLERILNELAPHVFTPMSDADQEHQRQQALAELHSYLMDGDAQPSILA